MEYLTAQKIELLCKKIKESSEMHFKIFFDSTYTIVKNSCLKMGLNEEDSEEIIQDTYIAFWKQKDLLDESNNPLGLLKTIASRKVIHKLNLLKNSQMNLSNETHFIENENIENEYILNEKLLQKYIVRLPSKQKEMLTLTFLKRCKAIEIAKSNNLSVRTVENTIYRAKINLKKMMLVENLNYSSFFLKSE